MSALYKYLSLYSEPESRLVEGFPHSGFRHALVIPCFSESNGFAERLVASPHWNNNLLVIVVINQPQSGEPDDPKNEALWNAFAALHPCWMRENLLAVGTGLSPSRFLVVDRFSEGRRIERHLGVGLARKIGCDLAARFYQQGLLQQPWIYSTDADVHLPEDYLAPLPDECSACVFPFQHFLPTGGSAALLAATQLYERAITYYERGLAYAGSPYAFATIGSAMAISIEHYAQARGFPKRAGAEDFYLLNKLAKLAPVSKREGQPLLIEARASDRVPFGTGPAVRQILAMANPRRDYRYYDPQVFTHLKQCLTWMQGLWPGVTTGTPDWSGLSAPAQAALNHLDLDALCAHLRAQAKSGAGALTMAHQWFDAFRTLKFVRYLQTHFYPALPLAECLRSAPFDA